MYGKLFASTFTGSMFGAGAARHATWGYIIANTQKDGIVEINPRLVAAAIGCTPEEVAEAIEYLSSPDPASRNKREDGRRIIREGEYQYLVVNYQTYRSIRNSDERKEYNREAKRRERSKPVQKSQDVSRVLSMTVNDCQAMSAQAEGESEVSNKDSCASATAERDARDSGFDAFWSEYPKKKSKGQALKAWKKIKAAEREAIMGGLARAKRSRQWLKDNGEYIPYPATWLNARGWEDEDASPDQGHAPKVTSDLPSRETLLRDEYMAHEGHPLVDEFYRAAKEDQSIEIDFQAWVEARND